MIAVAMIIVTGTARSGTSMWMQILIAAGYTPIGEQYPRDWGTSLREANRGGFWESTLRDGINYQTNPNPKTGMYIRPDEVTRHAVKVFIPGLVRSDVAYLSRVVVTARHWREHTASVLRMQALEDAHWKRPPPPRLDPAVRWFAQNFTLLGDLTLRGYPARICTYEDLLADPEQTLRPILEWIGDADLQAAIAAVRPDLRRTTDSPTPHEHHEGLEVLYQALRSGTPPDSAGRTLLASTYAAVLPQVTAHEHAMAEHRSRVRPSASATPESSP